MAKAKKELPKLVHQHGLKRSYIIWAGMKIWLYHEGYAGGGKEVRFHPTREYGPAVPLTKDLWEGL